MDIIDPKDSSCLNRIIKIMNVKDINDLIFVYGGKDNLHYLNSQKVRDVIFGQTYLCFRKESLKEDFLYLYKFLKLKTFS